MKRLERWRTGQPERSKRFQISGHICQIDGFLLFFFACVSGLNTSLVVLWGHGKIKTLFQQLFPTVTLNVEE